MARILTQNIPGTECIGDSLQRKINPNFLALDEAVQALSATALVGSDSTTVDLTYNPTSRQLSANIKDESITSAKLSPASGSTSFRNFLINGNFDIWQRRTTYTGNVTSSIAYPAADRWISYISVPSSNAPNGNYTISRRSVAASELASIGSRYYMRHQSSISTYGTTSMSSFMGDAVGIFAIQNIENAAAVLGKTVTISFWARASQNTKILSESQIHSSVAPPTQYNLWTPTINKIFDLTTEWQKFTHTYTMPTYTQVVAAGYDPNSVNVSNPAYTPLGNNIPSLPTWLFQIDLKTFQSLGHSIRHGNHANRPVFPGTALTVAQLQSLNDAANAMKSGGWYDIAQVQFELGDTATSFEYRPVGTEMDLCQRYFCKTYSLETAPGTATYDGSVSAHTDEPTAPTIHNIGWDFPTKMRVKPTVTVYAPGTGAINQVTRDSSNWPVSNVVASEARISWVNLAQNSARQYRFWYAHYTADAEI